MALSSDYRFRSVQRALYRFLTGFDASTENLVNLLLMKNSLRYK